MGSGRRELTGLEKLKSGNAERRKESSDESGNWRPETGDRRSES
jgi:hypothetical protein